MSTTTIAPEKLAEYLAGAREREQARRRDLEARRKRAHTAATAAARVLRQDFGATRVLLFGSLLGGAFHERSDIDLAIEGVAPERFLAAWAAAEQAAPGFEIDLVDLASARPWLIEVLRHEAIEP